MIQLVRLASPPGETGMLVVDSVVSVIISLFHFCCVFQLILTAMPLPPEISILSNLGITRI